MNGDFFQLRLTAIIQLAPRPTTQQNSIAVQDPTRQWLKAAAHQVPPPKPTVLHARDLLHPPDEKAPHPRHPRRPRDLRRHRHPRPAGRLDPRTSDRLHRGARRRQVRGEACKRVRMETSFAYALRRRAEAQSFRAAWDAAIDVAMEQLSDAAFARALKGWRRRSSARANRSASGCAMTSSRRCSCCATAITRPATNASPKREPAPRC